MRQFMTNVLRKAGYGTPELRKLAVAISFTESLGLADMYGDTSLETDEWGPSIGLFQIRSLKAEYGKGTVRDASRLEDPIFNAASALTISNRGTNWSPWSVYKDQSYLKNIEKNDFIVVWPEALAATKQVEMLHKEMTFALTSISHAVGVDEVLTIIERATELSRDNDQFAEELNKLPAVLVKAIQDKLVLSRTRRDVYLFEGALG